MRATFRQVLLLLLLVLPCAARAGNGVTAQRQLQHYVVEPGGAYRLTVEEMRATGGTYAIDYNAVREHVLAIEAWMQKPDGRRVALPVPLAQVRDRPHAIPDMRLKTVVLPAVAAGDMLVVRYQIRGDRALVAGHFEDLVVAPPHGRAVQVVYDMPPGVPLYADAAGFAPLPAASPPGRRRYAWRHEGGNDARAEAGAVSVIDYGRRLAVSTFADYPSFAAALRRGLAGKAQPTPPVGALARQLTAGLPDAHARAVALAAWVRGNVRYVDYYSGADSVVPRPAADVLAARYGDCKDHAVLLQALLAAAGIDSTAALVNNGAAYKLPDVPTLGVFNHMITYVPALGLYLDTAAAGGGDDRLAPALLGKPVLLVQTGTFAMTPLLQPHKTVAAATVDVGRDARFDGGTPVALATTPAAGGPVGASLAAMTREPARRLDYVCPAVDAQDATAFRLPAGSRVLALPAPVTLMDGGIAYRADYVRQDGPGGNAILVTRRLTFRHGLPTCTPADYQAMRPALERIARDLRSRIVVAGR